MFRFQFVHELQAGLRRAVVACSETHAGVEGENEIALLGIVRLPAGLDDDAVGRAERVEMALPALRPVFFRKFLAFNSQRFREHVVPVFQAVDDGLSDFGGLLGGIGQKIGRADAGLLAGVGGRVEIKRGEGFAEHGDVVQRAQDFNDMDLFQCRIHNS